MLTGVATESCSSYMSVTLSFRKIKYVKIIRASIPFYENDKPDKHKTLKDGRYNFNTLYFNKNDLHNSSVCNINVIVENHN